jgi:hypothetical protein
MTGVLGVNRSQNHLLASLSDGEAHDLDRGSNRFR